MRRCPWHFWVTVTLFVNFKIDKALAVGVITFILLFIMTLFYFKVEKKVNNDA